ncbi:CurL C-terminal domain-containing protein [Streptomyces sp. OZ13]|uniref:CurL C-terminal domain-containing protein n=1 Tax=Streptomyces sp. OZ13 TaxID=3452210 RepID=UPI003F8B5219
MTTTFLTGPDAPRVLAVSARDTETAAAACVRLAQRLEQDPSPAVDDVAATLAHGRERFPVRHAVIGTDPVELAAALRESADRPRPAAPVPALVLDLGDGSALHGGPELPQVAQASAVAGDLSLPAGADRLAACTAAALHGMGAWLAAHGLLPDTVLGRGAGAAAAAALRGELPPADALRAAATGARVPAAGALPDGAVVLRVGVPAGDRAPARRTGGGSGGFGDADGAVFALDPADPASYARVFAGLWEHGFDVDCTLGRAGRRVRLPGYPFRRSCSAAGIAPPAGLRALTPHEQRWLFHDLVRSGSAAEHALCATAVLPRPAPAVREAQAALGALLDARPALRTVFTRHGGRWYARASARPVPVTVLAPDDGADPVERVRAAVAGQTFAAADVPLVRLALAPAGEGWAVALAAYAPVAGSSSADELLAHWAELAGAAALPAAAPA